MVVNVITDEDAFKTAIATEKLVVVDFFATWCGPCKVIGPKVQAMSEEFSNVDFYKLDVDDVEDVAASEKISAMPTFRLYKGGKQVAELVGANPEKLKSLIAEHK